MVESNFGPRNPEMSAASIGVGGPVSFVNRDAELSRFGSRGVESPSEFRPSAPETEAPDHSSEMSETELPQAAIAIGGLTSVLEVRQ